MVLNLQLAIKQKLENFYLDFKASQIKDADVSQTLIIFIKIKRIGSICSFMFLDIDMNYLVSVQQCRNNNIIRTRAYSNESEDKVCHKKIRPEGARVYK